MPTEMYAEVGTFIHEIKNHISTLGLNLQLLSEDFADAQTPRERRAMERVARLKGECERLVEVSNDFLRFARVKDLERTPCDLRALTDEMVDFFAPVARSSNVEIKSYVPTGLPLVSLDQPLFKQALLNLFLNAQQAMPSGGSITIQATNSSQEVVLNIIDTGKGMSAMVLEKAFKPFYSTRQGGSGLGLPTAKRIIEAHAGTITAESEPGKGTRFTIRLPAVADAGASGGPAKSASPSPTLGPVPLCMLNGVRMPLSEAKVSALDRGFLFGDGVYEALRIYRGKPWLEEDHLDRLTRSLAEIRIHGADVPGLRRRMYETITAGGFREGLVYIQITRGAAPSRGHAFPDGVVPTELLWVSETGDPYAVKRKQGVSVTLQPDLRWRRCDVKSLNLLANVLACEAAREGGHAEAILALPDGTITEASHSSLFGVKDGVIRTMPLNPGILPGVTRKMGLRLAAKLGLRVEERSLHRDELGQLDELFLTGTSMEVCPIVRVDAQTIGTGKPGPVVARLQEAFEAELRSFLGEA